MRTVYLGDARVPFPRCGENVVTWERDGDARYPVPEVGYAGLIRIQCGEAYREYHVTVVEHGTLKTGVGGNNRATIWELGQETERTRPLRIRSEAEAEALNQHFLHCGTVAVGDEWDTDEAWPDLETQYLARRLLNQLRENGSLPTEDERRLLATCCG